MQQEIEAADMLRGKMQEGYKEQLNEQQGLVAELRQENKSLMEVSCDAALVELYPGHQSSAYECQVAHQSVSPSVLSCPHFAITEHALRLAIQNVRSHARTCFTVLSAYRKHVWVIKLIMLSTTKYYHYADFCRCVGHCARSLES